MSDGIGLAEALLGLDGFRVLEVSEGPDELVIAVESTVGGTTFLVMLPRDTEG